MPMKLVLVARVDLGMGKGKLAAQVAHAAVSAALACYGSPAFRAWLREGQPKVVLKVGSEEDLLDLCTSASEAGLPVQLIRDAGRTQLEPGTATCVALGPGEASELDQVSGHLALL